MDIEICVCSGRTWKPGDWDAFLASTRSNTLFLTSPWMSAVLESLTPDDSLIDIRARASSGRCLAAGLFIDRSGRVEFAGSGPSDYLDIAVDRELSPMESRELRERVFLQLREAVPGMTELSLPHVPTAGGTPADLRRGLAGMHVVVRRTMPAPTADREQIDEVCHRASLRRFDNKLQRAGKVEVQHYRDSVDILPRLDDFFAQHVRRWDGTGVTSQFVDDAQRRLFRKIVERLSPTGWLRFTEVRLDGRLAAAHLGFFHEGRFIWYKPTYEPDLASLSPGNVLIRRLFLLARDEGAREFDFTIGGEEFKSRYASGEREVVDLYLTPAWWRAARLKLEQSARKTARRVLEKARWVRPRPPWKNLPKLAEE